MLRISLQRQTRRIDGERTRLREPFASVFKRDRAPFSVVNSRPTKAVFPSQSCGLPGLYAAAVNPFRQAVLVQSQREPVARRCSQRGQAIMQLQHKSHRRQSTDRHRRIATLQPPERVAADKQPSRHVGGGNYPLPPRQRQIPPNFRSAWVAGRRMVVSVRRCVMSAISDVSSIRVCYCG